MAVCKLCNLNVCNVNAHVIPRWAYKSMLSEGPAIVATNNPKIYTYRSRSGDYDANLVCSVCESRFSDSDTYASRFFDPAKWSKNTFDLIDPKSNPKQFHIRKLAVDNFPLLHKFVVSLLWRISASDRPVWNSFSIGKKEDLAKSILLGNRRLDESDFPFTLLRFFASESNPDLDPDIAFTTPVCGRWYGMWGARITIPGFELRISTDSRPNPLVPDWLRIKPEESVTIGIPIELSHDIQLFRSIAQIRNSVDPPLRRKPTD